MSSSRRNAIIPLLLLVPAPTIGTWFGMYAEATRGTGLGQAIYAGSKLWILALPILWLLLIDRGRPSWSAPSRGGIGVGAVSGLIVGAGIILGWAIVGRHIVDTGTMRETAIASSLGDPLRYAIFALYLCTINAVLEEYVWRWFVYRKCETLLGRAGAGAVVLSALLFTIHHVLALRAQLDWLPAILASAGVFIGGCLWSTLYLRYRSIWPGFVSHVIVDIAIFLLGAWILFGAGM